MTALSSRHVDVCPTTKSTCVVRRRANYRGDEE